MVQKLFTSICSSFQLGHFKVMAQLNAAIETVVVVLIRDT